MAGRISQKSKQVDQPTRDSNGRNEDSSHHLHPEIQLKNKKANLQLLKSFEAHLDSVRYCKIISNKYMISAGDDSLVKLWKLKTQNEKFQCSKVAVYRGHQRPIFSAF